jgi:hypothetical protein
MKPLMPLVPAFAERRTTLPLDEIVPEPVASDKDPPVSGSEFPASTLILPPISVDPLPTRIDTSPPFPLVASPVDIDISPLAPSEVDPEAKVIVPVDPASPALRVLTTSAPELIVVPAPAEIEMSPPVWGRLTPLFI